jgi:serine/alanine adding enzyme
MSAGEQTVVAGMPDPIGDRPGAATDAGASAAARAAMLSASAELDAAAAREWDEYVLGHPRASLYHTSRWVRFVGTVFGFERRYGVARDASGRLVGLLPVVRQRSRLFGTRWVSLPFINYGGPLGESPQLEQALIDAVATGLHGQRAALEVRDTLAGRAGSCRTDKVSMFRDLPSSPEILGKQLGAKLRSQIRRADREGPTIVVGGAELADEFFGVFSEVMRDLGTPVYPAAFFRTLLRDVGQDCDVVVVRLNGQPAAAALLTHFRGVTEIPWAASRRVFRATSVNMRLYWECLSLAIRRQSRCFDFGRSTKDTGTYAFKAQWGAAPTQLYWYYPLLPVGTPPGRESRVTDALRRAWTRLPLGVASRLGPAISPGLPW